jgi:predicted porin
MKKTLIALAVLAASGASMAQSSVTLYGIADVWFGQTKTNGLSQTKIDSGGVSESSFGFKGSEDLGGGLKAIFTLEQGFNIDTGAQGTPSQAFNREASVGFAGGFGEVKMGRVWTALDDVSGAINSGFDSALSATSGVFKSTDFNANPANGVRYTSPNFGGFSGAVSYALGEKKTATLSDSSIMALNVQYANGPLAAVLGYQTEEPQGSAASVDYTRLGASYDLGVAKILASYGKVNDANDTNEYQIGVDFPVSSALTLSAGYATSKTENTAGTTLTERDGFGLAAAYSLSKRTMIYGGIQRATEDTAGVETNKATLYAVGVKHTF